MKDVWHRTFNFVSLQSSHWSLKTFFDHYDMFQAGERPDGLSPTAKAIMKGIEDRFGHFPSDMTDTVKRIAPI